MKNITIFKLQNDLAETIAILEAKEEKTLTEVLESNPFKECTGANRKTIGFIKNALDATYLSEGVSCREHSFTILTLKEQLKTPDKYQVKKELEVLEMRLEGEGKKVNKTLKVTLEEIATETILAKTLPKKPTVYTVAIRNDGIVFISANAKKAEALAEYVSLKTGILMSRYEPLAKDKEESVEEYEDCAGFLHQMSYKSLGVFSLNKKAKLIDPQGVRHALDGDLYESDLSDYTTKQNFEISHLRLNYEHYVEFTLTSSCELQSIKFTKEYMCQNEDKSKATEFILKLGGINDTFNELVQEIYKIA